ncbi:thiamine pyrophosphate-binding protein [Klugiella xanthotipulae]|uniref:Thiamine pyrophosphate-dependent acetolactate synthase large subunit-like protein n=1 Tax=Klugiella xanthotipulae TaxID=244735 RepID=A0A543HYU6_9MICO|nr:thiamine pyrophosphate-binding protein [Klugiella xanthotipulae]TQM63512.1 thiamine pyrophosphate-dependent acetolactate synthase large subunit-like protein [Klugiella xanthotipulae]
MTHPSSVVPVYADPARPDRVTVSMRVAGALAPHLTDCFGVMGNGNAHFLDALCGPDAGDLAAVAVRYTAVRHESGAVAAADAYYRASGRVALATATYGAGFTNTLTALAESVQARIPLLLVVGDAPSTGFRPWDIDQPGAAAALGARTFTVGIGDAAATAMRALNYVREHRTAAVLAIPYDRATATALPEADLPPLSVIAPVEPEAAAIAAASDALLGARRPLLLAGRGAWLAGAGPEAQRLADLLGGFTATTLLARGLFGESTADLGIAGGFAYDRAAELMAEADVLLVVGAGLNQFTRSFGALWGEGAHIIQIDREERATHEGVHTFVRGDARVALSRIAQRVARSPRPSGPTWRERMPEVAAGAHAQRPPGDAVARDGRLDPRSLARRLNEIIPANRTVVQDGGHFLGWAPSYWDISAPDRLVMVGTAFQSIGLGMSSAVGVGAAVADGTVVLCTGDGGALMALADFETVVRTLRSGIVVVFNDAAYGAEIHQYGSRGLGTGPMLIDEVDFAGVARSLGATAATVTTLTDLRALEHWVAAGATGVCVLDCRVSTTVRAPYIGEVVAAARAAESLAVEPVVPALAAPASPALPPTSPALR